MEFWAELRATGLIVCLYAAVVIAFAFGLFLGMMIPG